MRARELERLGALVASVDDLSEMSRIEALLRGRRAEIEESARARTPTREEELAEIERRARAYDIAHGVTPRPPSQGHRGRPRRTDIDPAVVAAALARHRGAIRPSARELGIPRDTLARHASRVEPWRWLYHLVEVLPHHARLLYESGVTPDVARQRWYRSVNTGNAKRDGLAIPLWTITGEIAWTQVRLDAPPDRRHRFRNQRGALAVIDVPPAGRARALDVSQTLYITESPRKADSGVSHGLACIDVPGIRGVILEQEFWDDVEMEDREVRIVFDGDAATNREVAAAERGLAELLRARGARVQVLRLPGREGLDNYLARGGAIEALPIAS